MCHLNGSDRLDRDSPPPGTVPHKLTGPRQQNGSRHINAHGHFIPDQASGSSVCLAHVFCAVFCQDFLSCGYAA